MDVIVHGGAGSSPDEPQKRRSVLEDAATRGTETSSPITAVTTAVRVLEASPRFNAGVGSCVQTDGIPRTDAGLMTDQREIGAVCSMPGVAHAIDVARHVMESTPHIFLAGVHAVDFAEHAGIETEVDLWSERTRERFNNAGVPDGDLGEQLAWANEHFGRDGSHDTVGAVATNGDQVAAATSTGGRWLALAGRVGDVPQVGAGYYASSVGGASATGAGEDIARITLSRRAVRHLEEGCTAPEAAQQAIDAFADITGSSAGIIVADTEGNLGAAHCAEAMQTARAAE